MLPTTKKRFLVIDDDEHVHRFFELCFSEEYDVRFAASMEETLLQVERDEFPVVTLDLNLNGESGLEILPALHERNRSQKIIILTGYGTKVSAISAINQDVFRYLEKPFAIGELIDAIREGFSRYSEERSREREKACSKTDLLLLGLNRKEAEIAHWVVQGEKNQEIATRLSLSKRNVEKYLEKIFSKLKIRSRMKLEKRLRELRGLIE
ncbi:MAG: response regulator transcription factor [Terrimicrobiaceae bacterium]|nr:response regulator transcription factor [Terrimicrobiaceae bacterium]